MPVVAVSGLLTKSLQEMATVAAALEAAGLDSYLLCGGAAVQADYVQAQVAPGHRGLAGYARDPFQALQVLKSLSSLAADTSSAAAATATPRPGTPAPETPAPETPAAASATAAPAALAGANGPGRRALALPTEPAFAAPFSGSRDLPSFSLDQLWPQLDSASLLYARWAYRRDQQLEAQAALAVSMEQLRAAGGVQARGRYGFWPVRRPDGDGIHFVTQAGEEFLPLPRQPGAGGLSLADYYAPRDQAALMALSLGPEAVAYLRAVHEEGDSAAYLRAHGLLAALTEAAAELYHRRILLELGAGLPAGKRYSFGYPGCPGVEYNQLVLRLLDTGRIGLRATATHQLDPEFSVTALLLPREGAVYFNA
jgi:5-methyltetrahydrofolate--homocysteine methyltransferase